MAQTTMTPGLQCPSPLLRAGAQGISRVAVDDANARLTLVFLAPVTPADQAYLLNPNSYSLTGGVRLFPRVLSVAPDPLGVRVQLDRTGDFSIYTLTVNGPDMDPFFASVKLRFRLACDDRFDCRPLTTPAPAAAEIPIAIDYLSKDYAGFRQALLDFIPTRLAAWTDRSEADLGMMLLELFAATADNLSYLQDRVANEAFLSTATQRRSVAGHLALIGYAMDEGAASQTWLQFQVNAIQVLGGAKGLKVSNQPDAADEPVIVFETMGELTLTPAHNRILLYDFGNANCCLPATSLSAPLTGHLNELKAGDYLLFDNGAGRDVVKLTAPPLIMDVYTLVTWSSRTPLRQDYCVGNTVVRGNILSATQGETVSEQLVHSSGTGRQRLRLTNSPLAHLDPGTPGLASNAGIQTALGAFSGRERRNISTLSVLVNSAPWEARTTLLGSGPDDPVFRVEIDDEGGAAIVFGDGNSGKRLPDKAAVTATYRAGGGARGNVGANTLIDAYPDAPAPWLVSVTNPLPATGGRDLESRDHARRIGPATFQTPLVAVTAADYETVATEFTGADGLPAIQRANASFRWTGSWLTVTLAVDPLGMEGVTPALRQAILDALDSKRLGGYDVEITSPDYVPVELEIQFAVTPGSQEGDVQQSLLHALGSGDLQGGMKGFFHPDNFTFGDNLLVSRLYAVIMAVPGLLNARITGLARLHATRPEEETKANLAAGFLAVGKDQIIRLDNDRNFPQNGTLSIRPMGVFL